MVQLGPESLGVEIGTDAIPRTTSAADAVWRLETALFWILLATLAAMPLPFGSARPWAWSLAALLIGLALLAYALGILFAEVRLAVPLRRLRLPLLLVSAPALWAFLQMTPLGGSDLTHPIWSTAAEALQKPISGRISVDPYATGTALMRLSLYLGIFFLAAQLCRNAERAFLALNVLVGIGAGYALYGLLSHFLMPDQLLWLPRSNARADLSSTFLTRHSYASFAGLGLVVAVALLAKLVHRPVVSSGRGAMLASFIRIFGAKGWVPAAAAMAILCAVLLTHSKGGLLATGIGLAVLLSCLLSATRLNRFGRFALAALVTVGILLTVHLASEALRTGDGPGQAPRAALHELVRQGISDSPLLGHGYGAFEPTFQSYGDGSLQGYFPNADNDYLEIAFDLGLPAASLLLLALLAVALRCLYGVYSRRRDIVYPALAVGAAALAGAQALIDFSLQIPATSALLAFILGLGYSQSWTSSDSD
jgi:O-antigen ligase